LAKELARQGHEVTVLTPKQQEHIDFAKKHNLNIIDLGGAKWKAIDLREKGLNLKLKRVFRRLFQLALHYPELEYTFLVKKAIQDLKQKGRKFDLLISIAVPFTIHWGVALTWENNSSDIAKTWVADCGDPFMGAENDTFKPFFYFKYVEKWFCKKVDYLTVPVTTAIDAYYSEFHHKIQVIPQGFNFDEVKLAPKENTPYPHFAYAGGLIPGRRDPKTFLEYLVSLDMDFQFDVYTNSEALIKSYAVRSKGRIIIKPYIPRLKLLYELSKLDFVVNFENAGQKQIPSKLIDYSIIKKPILTVNSIKHNQKLTNEFLNGDYSNALHLENLEIYKIENVAKAFLQLSK
jgi:hypothetical protein